MNNILRAHGEPFELAVLIVLYNKKIEESITITQFLLMDIDFDKIKLVIWNNGPSYYSPDLSELNSKVNVEYIETIENKSLSTIYNSFLSNCNANGYLFLDHDTKINAEYVNYCLKSNNNIIVPNIIVNGNCHSPKKYTSFNKTIILAIGSGVCISRKLKNNFSEHFGDVFDEKFYLYGVDTTFFLRVSQFSKKYLIDACGINIEHSLSRLEHENDKISQFRRLERSYDQGLTVRYYFSMFTLKLFLRKIIGVIFLRKKEILISPLLKTLFTGFHPRKK